MEEVVSLVRREDEAGGVKATVLKEEEEEDVDGTGIVRI